MLELLSQDPHRLHPARCSKSASATPPSGSSGRAPVRAATASASARDRRRPHRPRPPRRRVPSSAQGVEHRCEHRVGIVWLGGNRTRARPVKCVVPLGDQLDLVLLHAAEAREELGRDLRPVLGVDDRRRGRDAGHLVRDPYRRTHEATNEARDLRAGRARVRVGLVEDDERQRGAGEQLEVLLAREQQLELVCVRDQDPRLALADLLLARALLERDDVVIVRCACAVAAKRASRPSPSRGVATSLPDGRRGVDPTYMPYVMPVPARSGRNRSR